MAKTKAVCEGCGDEFEYYPSRKKGRFCSTDCRKEHGYDEQTRQKISDSLTAKPGEESDLYPWRDEETLHRLYVEEKMSVLQIADKLDCGTDTVYKWMDRHGIERRNSEEAALNREDGDGWVTHYYDSDGYEVCQASTPDDYEGRITVHRLVAIAEGADPHEIMGQSGLDVHHINGIPWDNRPSNLEPVNNAKHNALNRLLSLPREDAEEVIMLYRQRKRSMEAS